MNNDLLTGRLVRLAALNPEIDAECFARWDQDAEYMRALDSSSRRMLTAKKIKEWIEKEQVDNPVDGLELAVRTLDNDQLIGFVAFDGIRWQHADTFVAIGIGERDYRGKGYGTDALRAMLRYGFEELNLQRVSLDVFAYNERALKSYLKVGFVVEGRQRGMLRRDGQRWDFVYMSVLRDEWKGLHDDG